MPPPFVQLGHGTVPARRSPLDSLLVAQEIVELRENEASKQAEALSRAHASAAHAAATAIAAAADAAAARAAAAAATATAAVDLDAAKLSGAAVANAPRKGEPSLPTIAAVPAVAAPSATTMLAPFTISQLATLASMAPLLPTSVDALDLQVQALLSGYAARRALLLGGEHASVSHPNPVTPIDKRAKKAGSVPGAHGLRWRAPRGRMARELRGGGGEGL